MGAALLQRAITGRCLLYQSIGMNTAEGSDRQRHNEVVGVPAKRGRKHETAIIINRPADELFDYWRNLHHMPKLFDHLTSVVDQGDGRIALGR